MCLNMSLPLGMESQLRTSKLPPQTQQPHLLQRKNVPQHGNVFSQLVVKNMSDLQTFTVKEIVRPVAQRFTFFKSPVTPWWTEVRFEESSSRAVSPFSKWVRTGDNKAGYCCSAVKN